ncbi:MAG: diguanylate cyclase domain-containing protein, partial [Oscillospiraceae bacterium]
MVDMLNTGFAKDINVLVFASVIHRPELNATRPLPECVLLGESEIFNLVNYDLIDGMFVLGDSLVSSDILPRLRARAAEHNTPIININDPDHRLDINVELCDNTAMELVVEHIVEKHGCRRIDFIGGFPGNLQTEERLAAYKKVLTAHGIPIEEQRIGYGEFWRKAEEVTREFLKLDIPDAIVCASDTMAFFCMDVIKAHGLRIPEDIIVTGFDGIKDCMAYNPTLTSVRRAFSEAGRTAVEVMLRVWAGESVPEVTFVGSELMLNGSCGCGGHADGEDGDFYTARFGELNIFKEFNTYILEMNTRFSSADNSSELYEDTVRGADFFKLNKMFICICSDIERSGEEDLLNVMVEEKYKGVSDRMISMVQYKHNIPNGTEFSTKQLVPEDILNGEKPVLFSFCPLYFKDRFLGYIAFEPSKIKGAGDFFETWLTAINNNAGSFYMQNELRFAASRLADLYVRDPLTSLYNRRGLELFGGRLMKLAAAEDAEVTVICADVDGLKPINDNYGHEGGDNAILRVAEAIRRAVPDNAVCARTGGDEFTVLLSHVSGEEVRGFIARIDRFLSEYNESGGLPYKLGCSCGFHCAKLSAE